MKEQEATGNRKGKRKAVEEDSDEDDEDDDAMDLDISIPAEDSVVDEDGISQLVPLPSNGGIQALRDKLHARMASLRRGGNRYSYAANREANSRDELLEERRRQRADMRERRRKETKEKIRREAEERGKKGKEKGRDQGPQTKVRAFKSLIC